MMNSVRKLPADASFKEIEAMYKLVPMWTTHNAKWRMSENTRSMLEGRLLFCGWRLDEPPWNSLLGYPIVIDDECDGIEFGPEHKTCST